MAWSWGGVREWLIGLRWRSRRTVVLVDPDARWRAAARAALQNVGYRVVETATALEALHWMAGRRVRVVVTNYPMRLPSGRPLALALHANALPGLVLVAATSDARAANLKAAAADGCHAVIARPDPGALVDVVNLMTSLPVLVLGLPGAAQGGQVRSPGWHRAGGTLPLYR